MQHKSDKARAFKGK
jgi:hypothetical protein